MRKLASLRTIDAVLEHPNADRLSIYVVDGWKVIDAKERYQPGDVVVYCEIDSFLPVKNEFEFLRKNSFKRMGEQEGFRLRTIRLRGELSQGLLLPIDLLSADSTQLELGTDVSESLGIIKYERPIPPSLSGIAKGDFPGFIPKTDEERIQNLEYGDLKQYAYTVTEKLDGSSMTVFVNNGEIGVCSRNLELVEDANNTLWQMAAQYSLPEKLKTLGRNLAIQGELIGHKIQRNPYRLNAHDLRVFKVWDIDSHRYLSVDELVDFTRELNLSMVPVLTKGFKLPETVDEALNYADGNSELYATHREGVVLYAEDNPDVHFKIISNQFLENEK